MKSSFIKLPHRINIEPSRGRRRTYENIRSVCRIPTPARRGISFKTTSSQPNALGWALSELRLQRARKDHQATTVKNYLGWHENMDG